MSRSTISTFQLFEMFPDQETARLYLENRRWNGEVACPHCGAVSNITTRKNGFYRCNNCQEDFTVRTGTIFERSHVPLHKWIYAIYILMTARKGISSLQLAKEIGVTQKTAWFMLHRIREACGNDQTLLSGIVEVDEMYVGGREKNKHDSKKQNSGRGPVGKAPVVGMREKNGRTKVKTVKSVDGQTMKRLVQAHISKGSTLHTDESAAYDSVGEEYGRASVNHSAGEYSKGGVSTNAVESVWAVMKRGIYGVYHHVSEKHLARYTSEFSFRLNEGNVKCHTLDRLASMVDSAVGPRLTYKELIGCEN